MQYLKARWKHDLPDEAVLWFHELDDQRLETRKIVVFNDGHGERAGPGEETEYIVLSQEPLPNLEDINSQPEFEAEPIEQAEFEQAWARYGVA